MTIKQFVLPIIVFLVGLILTIFGGLLKILHYQIGPITGNYILTIGSFIKIFAIFMAIIKLIVLSRKK